MPIKNAYHKAAPRFPLLGEARKNCVALKVASLHVWLKARKYPSRSRSSHATFAWGAPAGAAAGLAETGEKLLGGVASSGESAATPEVFGVVAASNNTAPQNGQNLP